MIKQGSTKVALDRVPALAKALDADPAFIMQLALEQSIGQTAAAAVVEVFGEPVTANELVWLKELRDVSDNSDPRLTSRSRNGLRSIFGK